MRCCRSCRLISLVARESCGPRTHDVGADCADGCVVWPQRLQRKDTDPIGSYSGALSLLTMPIRLLGGRSKARRLLPPRQPPANAPQNTEARWACMSFTTSLSGNIAQ